MEDLGDAVRACCMSSPGEPNNVKGGRPRRKTQLDERLEMFKMCSDGKPKVPRMCMQCMSTGHNAYCTGQIWQNEIDV